MREKVIDFLKKQSKIDRQAVFTIRQITYATRLSSNQVRKIIDNEQKYQDGEIKRNYYLVPRYYNYVEPNKNPGF